MEKQSSPYRFIFSLGCLVSRLYRYNPQLRSSLTTRLALFSSVSGYFYALTTFQEMACFKEAKMKALTFYSSHHYHQYISRKTNLPQGFPNRPILRHSQALRSSHLNQVVASFAVVCVCCNILAYP